MGGVQQMPSGAEYFAGRIEGKSLIKVNLVGGVARPGVYYIPVETNLAELFAYAGGTVEGAQLEEVQVKSLLNGKWQFKSYDFRAISQETNPYPLLLQGDIVQIGVEPDRLVRTMLWVSVIGAVTSLAVAFSNSGNK